MTTPVVSKDRELGVGSPESGVKLKITDPKGPSTGGGYYFCPVCNKVVYSIYRDGPMGDETRNRFYCTCDGEQDMLNQTQVVTVLGLEDIPNQKDAKEFKEWLNQQQKNNQ